MPMDEAAKRQKGFAIGYLAGLAGLPVATAPVQPSDGPLAYLYNESPLPPLVWDRKNYPYALITYNRNSGYYHFIVYKSINYYTTKGIMGDELHWFGGHAEGTSLVWMYKPGYADWSQREDTNWGVRVDRITSALAVSQFVIWSNFDLMYSDGTLYLGGTEPEPIMDAEPWADKYFHNLLVSTKASDNYHYLDPYYRHVIIKTEDAYVYFHLLNGFGDGSTFYIDESSGKVYIDQSPLSWHSANRRPLDMDEWEWVDFSQCLGEEYEYNGRKFWYVCEYEDLVWSLEDIYSLDGDTVFQGTEPVPVTFPSVAADIDNKAVMLGCRLGYIIRSQLGKGKEETDVPMGVLISSDGYILCDCNGVYLIAKEDT